MEIIKSSHRWIFTEAVWLCIELHTEPIVLSATKEKNILCLSRKKQPTNQKGHPILPSVKAQNNLNIKM